MKNIITASLLGFFLILSLYAYSNKSADVRLKNLHYENSLGEKGITHFYYSQENKNYKAKWELLDGSRYSINYHFLNDDGNLIRKYREFSDSITSNNFYKYDDQGNLIEDYFERSDKVKGIVWYKYKKRKKVEAECRGLNGWFYGIIKYQYSGEQISKGIIYIDGREAGSIEYSYDEKGNLMKEFWDFGGRWNQTFTYEYEIPVNSIPKYYTYSSPFLKPTKNYIIEKEDYNWNSEKGGPSYYEYDGNKLIKKIYRYGNSETITNYEYDEQGLLMKSFRRYKDGRKAEFSYHYNENNQLIRRLFYGENGFVGDESYQYDETGKLIKAHWNKFDTWLTGDIIFQYEDDKLIKGKFKADNYKADLTFEFDQFNNLTKIHWEFNIGNTQTYEFKYKNIKEL